MAVVLAACSTVAPGTRATTEVPEIAVNFAHLDHLGENVQQDGQTLRIVHIYANAPTYAWVTDDDEGAACVDDAARAAVVYLRDFEAHGTAASRDKAEALLRFVASMQTDRGTFYNFVWDRTLRINTEHPNSKADKFRVVGRARRVGARRGRARAQGRRPRRVAALRRLRAPQPAAPARDAPALRRHS